MLKSARSHPRLAAAVVAGALALSGQASASATPSATPSTSSASLTSSASPASSASPTSATSSASGSTTDCGLSGPVVGLDVVQTANARTILSVTQSTMTVLGPEQTAQAELIALMTGYQESKLRRLANTTVPESLKLANEGFGADHDSVGVFQQRASWGSVAQRLDTSYATAKFLTSLVSVPGWQSMPPGQAAQSVQISAFPAAYDQWLTAARAWLLQLTGKAAPTGLNTACGLGSVAGLGALTTIPDYDIDPLLLKSLQTAVTRAQGQALAAQREYKAGQVKVTAARAQAAEMHTEAAQARVVAEQKRQQLQSILARAYVTGNSQLSPALTYLLSRTAASATAELNDLTSLTYLADRQDQQLMDALTAIAKADRLAVQADQATAAANAEAADLKTAYDTAENRVRSLTAQLQAEVKAIQAALAAKQAAGKASAATSLAKWQAYKGLLASAHVVAPAAAELADPSALPKGLTPVLDSSGHPVAGAAKAHTTHGDLLVLPREVIAAVDSALSKLGAPYVFGATGPTSFDCSGLVMSSYATGGLSIPRTSQAQFSYTTASRIAPGQELPGDLVFFAGSDGTNDAPGHVGMVLDASSELMIQAPQTGDVVKISSYGDTPVVGFGRVSITG